MSCTQKSSVTHSESSKEVSCSSPQGSVQTIPPSRKLSRHDCPLALHQQGHGQEASKFDHSGNQLVLTSYLPSRLPCTNASMRQTPAINTSVPVFSLVGSPRPLLSRDTDPPDLSSFQRNTMSSSPKMLPAVLERSPAFSSSSS